MTRARPASRAVAFVAEDRINNLILPGTESLRPNRELAGCSGLHEGTPETDLTQRSRSFFLKLGYAFLC